MHKLESFALSSGSKISKPFIHQSFYPFVDKDYICISRHANTDSENYDYYDDVAFHINPYLEPKGIKIIQIGGQQDRPIFYGKNYSFLNINQVAYCIKNSKMYVGNRGIYSSIASSFDKKIVIPSKIDYTKSFKPYWSSDSNCKILQSNRKNFKPVGAPNEEPKTINEIYPETISKQILSLLKIKNNLSKVKTLHIGKHYNSKIYDIIPNFIIDENFPKDGECYIRLDKHFDVNTAIQIASKIKVNIFTDQVIDRNLLMPIKDNIESISFFIKKDTSLKEVEYLSSIGSKLTIFAKGLQNINEIRLKLLEYDVIQYPQYTKKDSGIKNLNGSMSFLSRKTVFSEGQAFNSHYSASKKQNTSLVFDDNLLWEDLEFLRIFEEKA